MRADEVIKTDVVDQMYWDHRIDASDIGVSVDDGKVTLTGAVPTYTAKRAAADNAWLVEGVALVENEIEVEYPTTVSVPTDDEIRANVQDAFTWNTDLSAFEIDVSVTNGWVTLEGTVDAYWKKIEAEGEAEDVQGVIGVTNKLAVVPTEKITDESIAEDVVNAIDRNRNVNVDDIDVTVSNGRVTLTGTVANKTAKSAAYNSALYTVGVTDVEDNIILERF